MKKIYGVLCGNVYRSYFLRACSEFFYKKKIKPLTTIFWRMNLSQYGCDISPKAKIGTNLKMQHTPGIVIGSGVVIGNNVTLYQGVTLGAKGGEKYPELGDNVVVYANACILGDVKIGNNVVIGANTLVLKDIPSNSIAVGSPAKVIKTLDR